MADKLLVVEDDPEFRDAVAALFTARGYAVTSVGDGNEAESLLGKSEFDIVVLDVNLPGRSGRELLEGLRGAGRLVPVLMLTVLDSTADKIAALTKGADDYVTKPCNLDELAARVEALLRRCRRSPVTDKLRANGVLIDFARHEAHVNGQTHDLTAKEVAILRYLYSHSDRTVSRRELLVEVWGYPDVAIETRTVENHIAKLRQKVEPNQDSPTLIRTMRGEGYRWGGTLD